MAQITTHRLMQYAALAAAVPAAGAQAGIIAQTGLSLVINPGESALIDFGAGFGEVFRFELRTQSGFLSDARSVEIPDYYNAFFQFNPANAGGVNAAGIVAYGGTSSSGGQFINNDPERLGFGSAVSVERLFFEPMSNAFSTAHDLVNKVNGDPFRANGSSNWNPDARGFIGFKMFKDGSFHFGWFDVETVGFFPADQERTVGNPHLIIHGWGFQDEPRVGISTGDVPAPAAGGLLALAMGAAGIRRARRDAA